MSAAVLPFPTQAVRSTFAEGWAAIPTTMKTRSESRARLEPLWGLHAKKAGGQDRLLAALKAYLVGDKDLPKSGGPGLQAWLRAERYDHWLPTESSVTAPLAADDSRPRFPEPFRSRLVSLCGDGWVISYIDRATLDGTVLVVSNSFTATRIREQAQAMKTAGLTALRVDPKKV